MGLGINRLWVVGIFVVNIYYYGRNQRNSGIIKGVKKGTEKWKNGKKDLKKNTTN